MILGVFTLQPGLEIVGCGVGAPLPEGQGRPQAEHGGHVVGVELRKIPRRHTGHPVELRKVPVAVQKRPQRAMHQKVWVAANGRGEMGIVAERQPEMANALRAVIGLGQGPQHHGLEGLGFGLGGEALQKPLQGLRRDGVGHGKLNAQIPQVGRKALEPPGPRWGVIPVERRHLGLTQQPRRTAVRRDHAGFNKPVCVIAGDRRHIGHAPGLVEHDARFRSAEIEGAALLPLLPEGVVEGTQGPELGRQGRHRGGGIAPRVLVLEEGAHLGVGEPSRRANHRLEETIARHPPGPADVHLADHGQPIHLGHEGAQAIGEGLGEHGNDPAREVDARAPGLRALVQGAARLDVMANVGDGHQQAPSRAASGLGEDRVVEVLGVLPIDGHEGRATQIHSAGEGRLGHLLGKPCHLLFHGLGPVFLQVMGAQHHGQLPFVIEVSRGREHPFHLAPARATALGVGGQAQANPAARGRA